MMNKNERMEMLQNAGVNTAKYFTVDLDNGTKIHLIIDENGNPKVVDNKEDDPIAAQIIEDGYVRNTKLHRRFVMAQMFQMLNYTSYDGREEGYTAYLNKMYGYNYTLKMMLEEVRVLSKLEVRDRESFAERSHFFTKDVIVAVLKDYLEKLKGYVAALPDHKCKGVPYKRIKNVNIFNEDLYRKVYVPIECHISLVKRASNYAQMYRALNEFMKNMIQLPYNTPKSKDWVDAFKGEGAFYTCKNLIMFHNCYVKFPNGTPFRTETSMDILNRKLDEYQGEGWRMFAFMKKLIADNNFDFNRRMKEIYNK